MSETIYLGVDPGSSSGAMAIIGASGQLRSTYDWHFKDLLKNAETLESIKAHADKMGIHIQCAIENVHAFPQQGLSSTFKFGESFGQQKQALTCTRIGFDLITPGTWQRGLGISKKKNENSAEWKRRLAALAKQLHPELKFQQRKADAVLIAHYLWDRDARRKE